MKRMGVMILAGFIATMFVAPMSFADTVWIPMPTKVEKFKEIMEKHGMDLYGGDEADGYIEDFGTKIKIVTIKWLENDDLEKIKEAAFLARR